MQLKRTFKPFSISDGGVRTTIHDYHTYYTKELYTHK